MNAIVANDHLIAASVSDVDVRRNPRGAVLDLALSARLLPGVGYATVTKNGETVIELHAADAKRGMTAADAEQIALAEPEEEWCIHLVALLDDRHYRRVSEGRWVLYRRGYGLS